MLDDLHFSIRLSKDWHYDSFENSYSIYKNDGIGALTLSSYSNTDIGKQNSVALLDRFVKNRGKIESLVINGQESAKSIFKDKVGKYIIYSWVICGKNNFVLLTYNYKDLENNNEISELLEMVNSLIVK